MRVERDQARRLSSFDFPARNLGKEKKNGKEKKEIERECRGEKARWGASEDGHVIRGRPVLRSRVQQRGLPSLPFTRAREDEEEERDEGKTREEERREEEKERERRVW